MGKAFKVTLGIMAAILLTVIVTLGGCGLAIYSSVKSDGWAFSQAKCETGWDSMPGVNSDYERELLEYCGYAHPPIDYAEGEAP